MRSRQILSSQDRIKRRFLACSFFLVHAALGFAETPGTMLKTNLDDGATLATSPLRITHSDLPFIGGTIAIVGGAALLDRTLRDRLFPHSNSAPAQHLRQSGDYGQLAGPLIGVGFLLEGSATGHARSKETGFLLLESFVWAGAASGIIKFAVGRERPSSDNPFEFKTGGGDSSFPSGHTTVSFAAATVLTEQYPHWAGAVPAYGAASAVGFSRMYANKHWMSDVAAGAILGTAVAHTLRSYHRKNKTSGWRLESSLDRVRFVKKF